MYLAGNADDDRVDDALDDVRPLGTPEDLDRDDEQLRERVERLEEELDL
ncbi:hypothetical protein [Halorubrum distributum]|nr:hypothetical protein [Halorubrum distributum]